MPETEHSILRHVPNTLTVLRLIAVPVFIVLMLMHGGASRAAGLVFTIAACTDFLDGLIARRYGVMSQFGKVVDPIADRLLVNSAAMLLCFMDDRVYGWEFLVVVVRDVAAMYGFFRLRRHVLVPDVNMIGKTGMALMMAGMAWLLLLPSADWPIYPFRVGLVMSIVALTMYVIRYRGVMYEMPLTAAGESTPTGEVEGSIYSPSAIEQDGTQPSQHQP